MATSREEIGNGVHHGTVAKLKKEGIPVIPHRAVQMTLNDYEEYDYLIGMDTENIRNMQRIVGSSDMMEEASMSGMQQMIKQQEQYNNTLAQMEEMKKEKK